MAAQAAPDEAEIDLGRQVFQQLASPTCAACHALQDAQASGPIGPDLDELQPSAEQIRTVLRDGSGPMPSFDGKLTEEQIEAVVNYVVWATRKP